MKRTEKSSFVEVRGYTPRTRCPECGKTECLGHWKPLPWTVPKESVYLETARLIAAAPDMLAALQNALRSLDTDGPASAAASLRTIGRAALAKATQE